MSEPKVIVQEPKPQTAREYFSSFPEAPVSDTLKWIDSDGYEHLLTIRGYSVSSVMKVIAETRLAIAEQGGKPPSKNLAPAAPAPQPDKPAQIALEEGNKPLAAKLQAQADAVPPAPNGEAWNVYDAVFVRILPQPDNKVNIEFYGNERKKPHNDYAELKVNKWTVEAAAGLMKHVTSHDVRVAGEFSLPCRVYWQNGKEYTTQSGEKRNYKNVAHVR